MRRKKGPQYSIYQSSYKVMIKRLYEAGKLPDMDTKTYLKIQNRKIINK